MKKNNSKSLTPVFQLDEKDWTQFVLKHHKGTIFQTPQMAEVYNSSARQQPFLLALIDENKEIQALQLSVLQTQYSGLLKKMTTRSIVFGAPLVKDDDPDILDQLIKVYSKVIKGKAIYTQYRNLWDQNHQKKQFSGNDFKYEDHLDIHINIGQSEEILLSNLDRKRRNNVRRAEKKGLTFIEITDMKQIEEALLVIKKTYKRVKLPCPEKDFFYSAHRILQPHGMIRFFAAIFDQKIISVRIELCYKKLVYDWWAGGLEQYNNKYPNDFLPWQIMLWGHKNGYKNFDFGGAGKPGVPYGVRDHKIKFGGELVSFGRFEKVHNPFLMEIGKIGLYVWKKLR